VHRVSKLKVHAAPVGSPWMWTLALGDHEDRTPTHGYAATREAALRARRCIRQIRDGHHRQRPAL